MTVTEAAAPERQATPKFITRCEEFVFFTRVCKMTDEQARVRLGNAERGRPYTADAVLRWRAWLATHPECELQVLAVYKPRRRRR